MREIHGYRSEPFHCGAERGRGSFLEGGRVERRMGKGTDNFFDKRGRSRPLSDISNGLRHWQTCSYFRSYKPEVTVSEQT